MIYPPVLQTLAREPVIGLVVGMPEPKVDMDM